MTETAKAASIAVTAIENTSRCLSLLRGPESSMQADHAMDTV